MLLGLAGLVEHHLRPQLHLLKPPQQVVVDLLLRLDKLLHRLHELGVGGAGGADVQAGVVVQVGHVVGEVDLGGEEGVVEDLVRLGDHLDQLRVHLLALVRQPPKLGHVLLDSLIAHFFP